VADRMRLVERLAEVACAGVELAAHRGGDAEVAEPVGGSGPIAVRTRLADGFGKAPLGDRDVTAEERDEAERVERRDARAAHLRGAGERLRVREQAFGDLRVAADELAAAERELRLDDVGRAGAVLLGAAERLLERALAVVGLAQIDLEAAAVDEQA